MKICSKCKIEKDLSDFKRDKSKSDGKYSSCKECSKKWILNDYQNNKTLYKEKNSIYYKKNKKEIKERVKNYMYDRKKIDPLYKLKCKLRTKTYQAFKKNSWVKNSSNIEMLGCDFNFAKKHIESQFVDNMSWQNWGEWHLDHIIPLSSAKNEEELKKLFHYTNLQPLWADDNWKKSNKLL